MAVRNETELYAPLKVFFEKQGYEIKGEVRTCDMVGIRINDEHPLIVEMKKSFNLSLLLQGVERLKLSPNVILAVERCRDKKGAVNQRWGELSELCRRLGLGLMTVVFYKTKSPLVEVLVEPGEIPPVRRISGRRQEKLLYEFHERSGDYNIGGSTRVKLVTAYREKALRVAAAFPEEADTSHMALQKSGVTPAELRKRSGVPSAATILQHNYYGWFIRIARGRYALTPAGAAALSEYSAITSGYNPSEVSS